MKGAEVVVVQQVVEGVEAASAAHLSLPLPRGSVVVHIGPHKTGTTAVQSAFHLARRALAERSVRYAGTGRQPVVASRAVVARPNATGHRPWRALAREIAGARDSTVVVSSEWFADADPEAISRIVADLGSERVHVVVTLRPLVRLLPSQWQQYVKAGLTMGYEPWLRAILASPEPRAGGATPTFWQRHAHDRLVARWAETVGVERVVVIVADDRQPDAMLRAFERLVGLDPGILVPEPDRTNRSLTAAEVELVRAINLAIEAEPLEASLRLNLVLFGAAAALLERTPSDIEDPIETPGWAVERAAEIARQAVDGIRASGVASLGDLAWLAEAAPRQAKAAVGSVPWAELAETAALGVVTNLGLARGPLRRDEENALLVDRLPTMRLVHVVKGRLQAMIGRGGVRRRTVESAEPAVGAHAVAPPAGIAGEALDALYAALARAGVPSRGRSVIARGAALELGRSPDAGDWPAAAGVMVRGLLRATGVLPGLAPPRGWPPPMARVETLEVARVSTPALGLEIARRGIRRLIGRHAARIARAVARPGDGGA